MEKLKLDEIREIIGGKMLLEYVAPNADICVTIYRDKPNDPNDDDTEKSQ